MKCVKVTWHDSCSLKGWRSKEQMKADAAARSTTRCVTVGYVLEETEHYLLLVMTYGENGEVGDGLVIPKRVVERIRRLR